MFWGWASPREMDQMTWSQLNFWHDAAVHVAKAREKAVPKGRR